jgi:hypothetical protein
MPGQEGQRAHPDVPVPLRSDVVAEQLRPVRGVPFLGLGQFEQDGPFLARSPAGQAAVDLGLLPFVGEPPAPFAQGGG